MEKPKTGLLKHKKNKTGPESAEMKARKRERTMADMTKGNDLEKPSITVIVFSNAKTYSRIARTRD